MKSCPECGCVLDAKEGKPRSTAQHRRYFSLIRAAFAQWPETHAYQFSSAEELRAYLQMRAGYREVGAQIPLTGIRKEQAKMLAEAAIRAAGSYAIPIIVADTLTVFRPKSIAFAKLSHQAACELFANVEAYIEEVIGVPGDQLLSETEKAA